MPAGTTSLFSSRRPEMIGGDSDGEQLRIEVRQFILATICMLILVYSDSRLMFTGRRVRGGRTLVMSMRGGAGLRTAWARAVRVSYQRSCITVSVNIMHDKYAR